MKIKKLFLVILSFTLLSCGARVKPNFTNKLTPLTSEDKVIVLDIQYPVPENAQKLGSVRFGDTGFSVDCSLETNLNNAVTLARENGANVVKIEKKSSPDLWSTCYRLTVAFYYYDGDVTKLPQYQVPIKK